MTDEKINEMADISMKMAQEVIEMLMEGYEKYNIEFIKFPDGEFAFAKMDGNRIKGFITIETLALVMKNMAIKK